jgi:hypothetical protein
MSIDTHPHLRLDINMVTLPKLRPGDFVSYHCDICWNEPNEKSLMPSSCISAVADHIVYRFAAESRGWNDWSYPMEGNESLRIKVIEAIPWRAHLDPDRPEPSCNLDHLSAPLRFRRLISKLLWHIPGRIPGQSWSHAGGLPAQYALK